MFPTHTLFTQLISSSNIYIEDQIEAAMCVMLVCMALSLDKQLFISLLFRISTPLPFRLSSCFSSSYYSCFPFVDIIFLLFWRYSCSPFRLFPLLFLLYSCFSYSYFLPVIPISSCLTSGCLPAFWLDIFLPRLCCTSCHLSGNVLSSLQDMCVLAPTPRQEIFPLLV